MFGDKRNAVPFFSDAWNLSEMAKDLDHIWKALSDVTRREILDFLRDGPRLTTEIVERFPYLSRFGVMKHIEVLRESGLINTRSEGRRRINSLNAAPIRQILERWINKYCQRAVVESAS